MARRKRLLLLGMGLFGAACAASCLNAALLPFARALYGYPAAATLLALALSLAAFLLLGRFLCGRDEASLARVCRVAVLAFLAALFLIQLLLGYMMAYTPAGDNRMLVDGAATLARDGNFDAEPDFYLYFSRYSNQWGFLLVLTGLFRLFSALGIAQPLFTLCAVQAALYALGLAAGLSLAGRLRGARGKLMFLSALAACAPMYLAAAVLYTDTFSLPFVLLTLDLADAASRAESPARRALTALLCALCALVGAQIKMTVFIALIAACVVWLLTLRPREGAALCLLCALVALGGMRFTRAAMLGGVLDPDMVEQHHTPAVHWMMMSIPSSDNPYGGYRWADYAITWGMMEEGAPREEIMASIASRAKDKIYTLRYPNRLLLAVLRKNAASMGDGTFGMTEMLDDGPLRENAVSAFVLEGRPHYALYGAAATGVWLAHLLLAAAGCFADLRRRDTSAALPRVAAFGAMLFLMLWEARSRYIFGFAPVLLMLSGFAPAGRGEERA